MDTKQGKRTESSLLQLSFIAMLLTFFAHLSVAFPNKLTTPSVQLAQSASVAVQEQSSVNAKKSALDVGWHRLLPARGFQSFLTIDLHKSWFVVWQQTVVLSIANTLQVCSDPFIYSSRNPF